MVLSLYSFPTSQELQSSTRGGCRRNPGFLRVRGEWGRWVVDVNRITKINIFSEITKIKTSKWLACREQSYRFSTSFFPSEKEVSDFGT